MSSRIILVINANDNSRQLIRELLEKEDFKVFDFNNSMSAILWIKKNEAVAGIVIEEKAAPLNAYKVIDYVLEELKMELPVVIVSEEKNSESNKNPAVFISNSLTEHTIKSVKEFLNKPIAIAENKAETPMYSLQYLRDTYDGDEELILESLTIFEQSVSVKIQEMEGLLLNQDFEEIRKVAHNIKPSFEMLSNKVGSMLCHNLVYQTPNEEICQMVDALNNEFIQLKNELSNPLLK
ncbi:Hpt domain-containing protein [Flavimarina sp. Hel_I_48]|uniref:Hpt domain-containing protein n=1 Tax=Flavimarina sp. Hel_I_48 TaxID=1392488 RepID=UPI0004DF4C98|nr:Hpt domain-containing protein [Flavimarina sp. Hel_I_48]